VLAGVVAPAKDLVLRTTEVVFERSLRVLVLTPDGQPVAGAAVVVSTPGFTFPRQTTDAQGRSSIDKLPDDLVSVTASPSGSQAGATILSKAIRVLPQGQELTVSLRAGVPLRGRVMTPTGDPVNQAMLTASGERELFSAKSDAQGRFVLMVAPGRTYDVRARTKERSWSGSATGVAPEGDEITITLAEQRR
jgi:hypothetical protein